MTEKTEKTKDLISWSDLETLSQLTDRPSDPDRLFDHDPETDRGQRPSDRLFCSDPETVSLFLVYGSKINRMMKRSDKRLKGLRSDFSFYSDNMENVT